MSLLLSSRSESDLQLGNGQDCKFEPPHPVELLLPRPGAFYRPILDRHLPLEPDISQDNERTKHNHKGRDPQCPAIPPSQPAHGYSREPGDDARQRVPGEVDSHYEREGGACEPMGVEFVLGYFEDDGSEA